jgi:hypothetical protein
VEEVRVYGVTRNTRTAAKQDLQLLNAQKIGNREAEIAKINSVFLAILRDIKKVTENGEQPGK